MAFGQLVGQRGWRASLWIEVPPGASVAGLVQRCRRDEKARSRPRESARERREIPREERDHVRIAQATTVAFDEAAQEGATLYYWCLVRSVMRQWAAHNRGSVYDAVPEDEFGCPDELITTVVDVADLLPLRLEAIRRHRSQASPYDDLPADLQAAFLATDRLIRARPPWLDSRLESELTVHG